MGIGGASSFDISPTGTGQYPQLATWTTSSLIQSAFGNYSAATVGPTIAFIKSRGATVGTNTAVVSGDSTGNIIFRGADGTNYKNSSSIQTYVDATVSAGIVPGRLMFLTTDTAGTLTERMRIDSSGNVGIGTTSPKNTLDVSGSVTLDQNYQSYLVNSYYNSGWKYIGNGFAWGIGNNFGGVTNGVTIAVTSVNAGGAGAAITWTPTFNIDSSGNVGIGTASPQRKLDVAGGARFVQDTTATTGAIVLRQNSGDTVGGYIQWVNNAAAVEKGWINVDTSSNMIFATVSTERMRIDSSGSLLVGTTSNPNSSKLYVTGSTATASAITSAAEFRQGGSGENGGQIAILNTFSSVTNPNKWIRVDNSGNLQVVNSAYSAIPLTLTDGGNLTISGATATKASGTTWANPSDQRLKNNIRDYEKGSAELMQIRVREWEYNGKAGTTEGMKGLGVIADEVMTVLPDTVENYEEKLNADDEEKTAIKKFDATEITWLLVKTVQEQQALIVSMREELDALKTKVGA
jgi:hypothetical protein